MHLSTSALTGLRRHRVSGVGLFIGLICLVAGERRLAEAHFNLRSTTPGVERADALDGDEIRVRLVVLNDDRPPSLSALSRPPIAGVSCPVPFCFVSVPLGHPAPRGPPTLVSSIA